MALLQDCMPLFAFSRPFGQIYTTVSVEAPVPHMIFLGHLCVFGRAAPRHSRFVHWGMWLGTDVCMYSVLCATIKASGSSALGLAQVGRGFPTPNKPVCCHARTSHRRVGGQPFNDGHGWPTGPDADFSLSTTDLEWHCFPNPPPDALPEPSRD